MITALWGLCANRVIVDQRTNQVSIIDVIENVNFQSFPATVPSLSVIFFLKRDSEDEIQPSVNLEISQASGVAMNVPITVDFTQSLVTRSIVTIGGFVFPREGLMKFKLTHGERQLGECEIAVQALKVPAPVVQQ